MSKQIPTDQKLYDKIKEQVKATVDRYPSAYASGQIVQQYKTAMEKKYNNIIPPYINSKPPNTDLARWYKENWVDIKTGKPCGDVKNGNYYPTCRPINRITSKTPVTVKELTSKQKKEMIAQKQDAKKKTVNYKL